MEIPFTERIKKMRSGQKIKCPKCDNGLIAAVGDSKTTLLFSCDKCARSIVLTVK